jgi:hypothetical protein
MGFDMIAIGLATDDTNAISIAFNFAYVCFAVAAMTRPIFRSKPCSLRASRCTETGYKSHFVAIEAIEAAGGHVAYASAWIEDAAQQDPAWKALQAQRRQWD